MKYIKAIKYIDAVSREKQHELPDPLHIMIALYEYFGCCDTEAFKNYRYFRGSVDNFKRFLARSRNKQMEYYDRKRYKLKRCVEFIEALTAKQSFMNEQVERHRTNKPQMIVVNGVMTCFDDYVEELGR